MQITSLVNRALSRYDMPPGGTMEDAITVTFEEFLTWVVTHPNCILRAGTPEVVIFDDDDLHWHFAAHEDGTPVVQVLRGKRLIGELFGSGHLRSGLGGRTGWGIRVRADRGKRRRAVRGVLLRDGPRF